jgi:signal transduction histidine kinase
VSTLAPSTERSTRSPVRARASLEVLERAPLAPAREAGRSRSALDVADRVIVDFATAADVYSGMEAAVARLSRADGVDRVEWWAPTPDGSALRLATAAGRGGRRRSALPLGLAGALVVTADQWSQGLVAAVNRLAPVVRRRWTEERLAEQAAELARRNEALDDFAALVAHELKAPLHAALLCESPAPVEHALALVDALLEAVRAECSVEACSSPAESLRQALCDLGSHNADVVADLPESFPLPGVALRVMLRNLIANGIAAGAQCIEVTDVPSTTGRTLVVDDDGVGLDSDAGYCGGSGIGLGLMRRLAGRHGGSISLTAGPLGGTRVTVCVPQAAR